MSWQEVIEVVKTMAKASRLSPEDKVLQEALREANKFCKKNDIEGLYQEGRNLARSES